MCLNGQLETMIEVLTALNDASLMLKQWKTVDVTNMSSSDLLELRPIEVTQQEGVRVIESRIETLEQKCRELGIHGPAPKADPGDQRRIVDAK